LPSGIEGRYVRVTVNGNTQNEWASITEIAVFGDGGGISPPVTDPSPLYHRWQNTAGSTTSWSAYHSLGSALTGDPAVARNSDGRLEVFVIGANGNALYHKWQNSPGTTTSWSAYHSLGGSLTGSPAAAINNDNRLGVFVIGANGNALYQKWQNTPGSTTSWSAYQSLGGSINGDPAAARNSDGRLEVFVMGGGTSLDIDHSASGVSVRPF